MNSLSTPICPLSASIWRGGAASLVAKPTPQQVLDLSVIVAIAAGTHHSLALSEGGDVWAWGLGAYGALGTPPHEDALTPVLVPALSGVSRITSRHHHCLALVSGGGVMAWGLNTRGQCGGAASSTRHEDSGAVVTTAPQPALIDDGGPGG